MLVDDKLAKEELETAVSSLIQKLVNDQLHPCGTQRNRPTPEGRKLGDQVARLTEKCITQLEGEEDERCASCAYRRGTFPNGCPETILDALKCVMEDIPFFCHAPHGRLCFGWYAARVSMKGKKIKMPYDLSQPATSRRIG